MDVLDFGVAVYSLETDGNLVGREMVRVWKMMGAERMKTG